MIYAVAIITVVLGVAMDQFTKYLAITYIKDNPITILEGVFQLRYLENHGAAFGMLQNQQWFFLIITVVTLGIVTFIYLRLPKEKHFIPLRICLVILVAGAIGNMIDRIRFQYVVDIFYFELIDFPIFNVADIFATVSTLVLILLFLFYYSEEDFDLIFQIFKSKRKENQG